MLPGEILAVLEIGPEIPVQELNAILAGSPFRHLPHQLVILIGRNEQGRGEAVEAAFRSLPGGFKEPHFVAFDATAFNIRRHFPDEGPQTLIIPLDERKFDHLGVFS